MESTEIVNNRLALCLSSFEPIILAISKATGANAAYIKKNFNVKKYKKFINNNII